MDRCPPMSRSSPEDILWFTALLRRMTASPEFQTIIRIIHILLQPSRKKIEHNTKNGMRPITTDRMPFFHIFSLYW